MNSISRTSTIDGVANCINTVIGDKNGHIYGVPQGNSYGPNMLAYNGSTLKWKYPVACTNNEPARYAVGGNGNIYTTNRLSSGDVRLIGLTPNVAMGQTQPTKVLDVDIDNDCSTQVTPYKDGLMLQRQSGVTSYYNYAGKPLTSLTVPNGYYSRMNADGVLFSYSYVGGATTGLKVSAYDPYADRPKWEVFASTPGANANNGAAWLHPLSNGGVLAVIREQKLISGIPASPTEWVWNLVAFSATGVKTWSELLSNTTGSSRYDTTTPQIGSTTSGKVVVMRDVWQPTTGGSAGEVPALEITTRDPLNNGAISYVNTMQGRTDKTTGPAYGYRQSYGNGEGLVTGLPTGPNTLYLLARCYASCPNNDNSTKLYPVAISGIGLNYPRATVLNASTSAQPTALNYVALGDSYSSGQGAGDYDPNTTISTNQCYQSRNSYGKVLGRDPYSKFNLKASVACGGALATDITTTKTYPDISSAQKYAVDSTTQVATLTIGGNDIGFANVITTCANPLADCDAAFNQANAMAIAINGVFANSLQSAYLQILARNPQVKLYVLGYPPVFATGSSGCAVGNNGSSAPVISAARVTKSLMLLANLNNAISNNVAVIKSLSGNQSRIQYVPAVSSASPFNGHEVCTSNKYINGLTLPQAESFHPNKAGNKEGYANLVKANS